RMRFWHARQGEIRAIVLSPVTPRAMASHARFAGQTFRDVVCNPLQWHRQPETRALSKLALDIYRAAMQMDNFLHAAQAKPCTGKRRRTHLLTTEETLKNVRQIFSRDPDPGILDGQTGHISVTVKLSNEVNTADFGIRYRVDEQLGQGLSQIFRVAP